MLVGVFIFTDELSAKIPTYSANADYCYSHSQSFSIIFPAPGERELKGEGFDKKNITLLLISSPQGRKDNSRTV
jgi:hypothetical protein